VVEVPGVTEKFGMLTVLEPVEEFGMLVLLGVVQKFGAADVLGAEVLVVPVDDSAGCVTFICGIRSGNRSLFPPLAPLLKGDNGELGNP
jgi:hypothetical protein